VPHALIDLSWRTYPAPALAALGTALALAGLRAWWAGWRRPPRDPDKPLALMLGFRRAVIGLALMALAAAWAWHQPWLLALALAIGGEETLESSIAIYALRRARRLRAAARPSARLPAL
jgi:hypothetical protein